MTGFAFAYAVMRVCGGQPRKNPGAPRKYDFFNTQGSVYLTDKDDMANLFAAIYALKKITWFKASVRDIRAFKVENWSDFTQIVKGDD